MGLEVEGPPGHGLLELLLNAPYLLVEEAVSVLLGPGDRWCLREGGRVQYFDPLEVGHEDWA